MLPYGWSLAVETCSLEGCEVHPAPLGPDLGVVCGFARTYASQRSPPGVKRICLWRGMRAGEQRLTRWRRRWA